MFTRISFRLLLASPCAVSLCEILVLPWRKISASPCANIWCPWKRKVVLGGNTVAEVAWIPLWPCEGKLVNGYTCFSLLQYLLPSQETHVCKLLSVISSWQ